MNQDNKKDQSITKKTTENEVKSKVAFGGMAIRFIEISSAIKRQLSFIVKGLDNNAYNDKGSFKNFVHKIVRKIYEQTEKIYKSKSGKIFGITIGIVCGTGLTFALMPLITASLFGSLVAIASIFAIPTVLGIASNSVRNAAKIAYTNRFKEHALCTKLDDLMQKEGLTIEDAESAIKSLKQNKDAFIDELCIQEQENMQESISKEFPTKKSNVVIPAFSAFLFVGALLIPAISSIIFFPPLTFAVVGVAMFGAIKSTQIALSSLNSNSKKFDAHIDEQIKLVKESHSLQGDLELKLEQLKQSKKKEEQLEPKKPEPDQEKLEPEPKKSGDMKIENSQIQDASPSLTSSDTTPKLATSNKSKGPGKL